MKIYSDHCHFSDARDDFGDIGLDAWARAVHFLFIGEASKLALTNDVVLDEAARTVTFTGWRQVCGGMWGGTCPFYACQVHVCGAKLASAGSMVLDEAACMITFPGWRQVCGAN